ncbi:MAG: hypothetical protein NVSMB13_04820 [Mycobacteriales bacterium]
MPSPGKLTTSSGAGVSVLQPPDAQEGRPTGSPPAADPARRAVRRRRLATAVGAVAGLSGAGVVAALGWVPAHRPGAQLPAAVTVAVAPTGELGVTPSGPILAVPMLTPKTGERSGSVRVSNQTGTLLATRVQAAPNAPDLDRLLSVRVTSGDVRVFEGMLCDLCSLAGPALTVVSGMSRRYDVTVWLPADTGPGYLGRIEDVALSFPMIKVTTS